VPSLLARLLPPCVSTVEVDLAAGGFDQLLPEEAAAIANASQGRALEFRAGRHCARRALAQLGVEGVPILRAADRSPIWPAGIAGSISHTRRGDAGYCCAAVVRKTDLASVGVDAETAAPLEPALWSRILTQREQTSLERLEPEERGRIAKLVFSAKESFYKCQHALSGLFLEFGDVEIDLDLTGFRFQAILGRDAEPFSRGATFEGTFGRGPDVVITAAILPPRR
jgi:4'-phosphopantetheinyl transferase EntD